MRNLNAIRGEYNDEEDLGKVCPNESFTAHNLLKRLNVPQCSSFSIITRAKGC